MAFANLENLSVEISKPRAKPFVVSTWYRPPNSSSELFGDFEAFVGRLDSEGKEHYIMGDLNCNMLPTSCSNINTQTLLRAPDQKYRESDDRSEISYFILFHQKYPFGKLFSKIIIKSPSAYCFFPKIRKVQNTARSSLAPPGNKGKLCIFSKLVRNNRNRSRSTIWLIPTSFFPLSKNIKIGYKFLFLNCLLTC